MVLPLITADQRLKEPHSIKGCIFGKSDIGKTSSVIPAAPMSSENLWVQENNFSRVFSKKPNISAVSEEKPAGPADLFECYL